ncbi:dodecin family protein [Mycolicibacterium gadium]|uniref:Dodecin family protein n=1 Tax=Mycolicibacterium gadium TaxID=1794 RepID=A0ABT6GZR7_MYCGU|nr:dodecin family protein [Mycolicibacterium gadium]MDG5486717.1 dodecin family protein [Mycolicibacterium gadium]
MAVSKAVELIGTGITIEDAISEATDRASDTLQGVTGFTVDEISGAMGDGRLTYRVRLRVWFILLERMHDDS